MHVSYASKWLYCRVLLDIKGISDLLSDLGEVYFFPSGQVVKEDKPICKEDFISEYGRYLESLQSDIKPPRSFVMTSDLNAVYGMKVRDEAFIIKQKYPVIQVREFRFVLGSDLKVQSMVFGKTSISWGLQFAYPQLFIDPDSKKAVDVLKEEKYTNSALFLKLQRWMRHHTKPVPLKVASNRVNASFRMSSSCSEWIHKHPDLKREELEVYS